MTSFFYKQIIGFILLSAYSYSASSHDISEKKILKEQFVSFEDSSVTVILHSGIRLKENILFDIECKSVLTTFNFPTFHLINIRGTVFNGGLIFGNIGSVELSGSLSKCDLWVDNEYIDHSVSTK